MNKEIKKILDRLERIDHKEYKTAFEFADSATFEEMARCFKERMIMADYITNLQDNELGLETKINVLESKILELQQELLNKKLNVKDIEYKEKMIYKSRIDKAIHRIQLLQMGGEVSIKDLCLIVKDLTGGDE